MSNERPHVVYLGDSVYIHLDTPQMAMIYTDNGEGPENVIYLDSETVRALELWLAAMHKGGLL